MKRDTITMFAACAAVAVAAGAALPLCAAELTHRWCFNGDFADSVGGVDAAVPQMP